MHGTSKNTCHRQRQIDGLAVVLWTYVDVRDAAAACRLSIETDLPGHEAFFIAAPDMIPLMDRPSTQPT